MLIAPVTPSLEAIIVAEPGATHVSKPVADTVATAVLLLAQVTTRPGNTLPVASLVVEVNWNVAWTLSVAPRGTGAPPDVSVTTTDATGMMRPTTGGPVTGGAADSEQAASTNAPAATNSRLDMYDIFLLLAGAQRTLLSLQLVLRASRRSQNSTFVGSNRAAQGGSYPEKLGCCGHRRNIELLQPMSRCAARVEKWGIQPMQTLQSDWHLQPLRRDPRYRELLRRIGLPTHEPAPGPSPAR